jgi:hypothetical protein
MSCFSEFVDEMIVHVGEVDRALGRFQRGVEDQMQPVALDELGAAADRLTALSDRVPDVPPGLTRRRRDSAAEIREWYGAAVSKLAAAAAEARAGLESSGRVSEEKVGSKIDAAHVILVEMNRQLADMNEDER